MKKIIIFLLSVICLQVHAYNVDKQLFKIETLESAIQQDYYVIDSIIFDHPGLKEDVDRYFQSSNLKLEAIELLRLIEVPTKGILGIIFGVVVTLITPATFFDCSIFATDGDNDCGNEALSSGPDTFMYFFDSENGAATKPYAKLLLVDAIKKIKIKEIRIEKLKSQIKILQSQD